MNCFRRACQPRSVSWQAGSLGGQRKFCLGQAPLAEGREEILLQLCLADCGQLFLRDGQLLVLFFAL